MKVNKMEIAHQQLELALELFMSKTNYICAITLAGAAEEIFADLVKHRGGENHLYTQKRLIERIEKKSISIKQLADIRHLYRNALKHADRDPDAILEFDEVLEAKAFLCGALTNYFKLDIEKAFPMMEKLWNYLSENKLLY
ncbi:hypothetical protein [Metapseudomonas otitidis]|uniref:hypothetical protein n=1 Tax=Metapseudomonas otitidis TaxID=319939 RepID=UPI003CE72BF8